MFSLYTFFLYVTLCASSVLSGSLISPCKIEDSDCIEKSVNAAASQILVGIPSLGVDSSDPLFIEKIDANVSILKYQFFNTTITGYKDCKVSDIKVNPELTTLHYELYCPEIRMSGIYEVSGRLIVLPVEGKGDYELISGKYKIIVDAELKQSTGSDEKTYLSIKNFKLKCTALSANHFDFKNLFNGQKDLSDTVHKFAHENWKEVAELVQDPVWYASMKKVMNNVNKYLKNVPVDDYKLN